MKTYLKSSRIFKYFIIIIRTFYYNPGLFLRINSLSSYFIDLHKYSKLNINENSKLLTANLFPRIWDKTISTKLDPVYYLQGLWCSKKVFENKPQHHIDIGSQALMVGIISQFVPTSMVDIRPLSVSVPELEFIKGDITNLPFVNDSINSISSICVIEHIGLGRYGDTLDQFGTEKSISELIRVLAPTGNLYISVPIDSENRVYFNAHRAFTRKFILESFRPLKMIEEKYIYGNSLHPNYNKDFGFGTGLFHFTK